MTLPAPFYSEDGVTLLHGDCLAVLRTLESESVQTCVTSPPYFGLRDYGTAEWHGGDEQCPHRIPASGSTSNKGNNNREGKPFRDQCGVCGALRIDRQIGLEETPEQYVAKLVQVFDEVRRVLRKDGVLWCNLGDSYATSGTRQGNRGGISDEAQEHRKHKSRAVPGGYKEKDLLGIPWMVAFALRAAGWYLRSDIIWHKPSPMPESVTDRPTKAHEYIFLLAKSERYCYDADAVAEPSIDPESLEGYKQRGARRTVAADPDQFRTRIGLESMTGKTYPTRNKRSVWTVTTTPYPGAHFATFPPDLIEPCIKAGSKPGDIVLDPFNGSGTTGEVAQKWGRRYIGIDLNREYLELSKRRFQQRMLFAPEAKSA